ncbi:spore germination protein [Clostridium sp. SYSU_GA19001]|uniref:GerAB/ArcD/ProY family transporter n=1 Tax=Clostridium caldaquaticum TaxID=2940653 RepID=UPI002077883B|nr:GerAB/ArcD/ProY family transporter [Clostridium caldaquaticum]MCM8709506.1 spore germination protein [Clostridium caldaquaticum]
MEKAKISLKQFFAIIVLFELGSAVVVGLGMKAGQAAWLAIIVGMLAGLILFKVYGYLYNNYTDLSLTGYIKKLLGPYLGFVVSLAYITYFMYIASRVLRDFSELIVVVALPNVSTLFVSFSMLTVIAYGNYLGIEVLGRAGEICFVIVMSFILFFIIIIFGAKLPKIENLLPIIDYGTWKKVFSTAFPLTLTFPFGEMIVFTMFLPNVKNKDKVIKTGLSAMLFSGIILSIVIALNISVIGAHLAGISTFPFLKTLSKVAIGEFLQRLDSIAIFLLILGVFFKISIFFYASLLGISDLIKVKDLRFLIIPVFIIILIANFKIAENIVEHLEIGLEKVPLYIHIPLQIGIPLLLAFLTYIKRKFIKG